jgi:hypothetical protein
LKNRTANAINVITQNAMNISVDVVITSSVKSDNRIITNMVDSQMANNNINELVVV